MTKDSRYDHYNPRCPIHGLKKRESDGDRYEYHCPECACETLAAKGMDVDFSVIAKSLIRRDPELEILYQIRDFVVDMIRAKNEARYRQSAIDGKPAHFPIFDSSCQGA